MKTVGKILIVIGCIFLLFSAALLACMHFQPNDVTDVVNAVNSAIPEKRVGIPETSSDEMPSLEIDNNNIIALVRFDDYSLTLPVCDGWDADKIRSMPRRFCGSAYNGSLVIGGCDAVGHFSCLDKLEIGSSIVLTDMTGTEYYYLVDRVERTKTASTDVLVNNAFDLTLFMRDELSLDYIIVRCVK